MNDAEKKDLAKLEQMKPTQWQCVNWHEEGGGEVQRVHDVYVLFEVPRYGGEPNYVNTYHKHQINILIEEAYSWT